MGTELELKLRLCPSTAQAIIGRGLALPPDAVLLSRERKEMRAVYYDTPARSLQAQGMAYRVRKEDDGFVATLKRGGCAKGGLHKRQEWNAPAPDEKPSVEFWSDEEAAGLLHQAMGNAALEPLFATNITRHIWNVALPHAAAVEAVIDLGAVIAGARQDPVSEMELELKTGTPGQLLKLAAWLAERYPMQAEMRSKYSRGLALAGISNADYEAQAAVDEDLAGRTSIEVIQAMLEVQSILELGTAGYEACVRNAYAKQLVRCLHELSLREQQSELSRMEDLLQQRSGTDSSRQAAGLPAILREGRLTALGLGLWASIADRKP